MTSSLQDFYMPIDRVIWSMPEYEVGIYKIQHDDFVMQMFFLLFTKLYQQEQPYTG